MRMSLYDTLLPHIQDANTYGGGASTFLLRRQVFDTIDRDAGHGDKTMIALRKELYQRSRQWKQPENHEALSRLFDIYCEATFYITATGRGVVLEAIPRGDKSTPDFRTSASPHVHFEIKTVDIANPTLNYPQHMIDGFDANIEAHEQAKLKGVGSSEHEIAPHGNATTWIDVIRQTMEKLAGNIKKEQYTAAPTFLVANLGRASIHADSEELISTRRIPASETFENKEAMVSGQLWTIANHTSGCPFVWQDTDTRIRSDDLERAGLLKDFDFIKGIIFTTEPWNDAYKFLGIWNDACSPTFDENANAKAKDIFRTLCTSRSHG